MREYVKARKARVWGESGPELAKRAEELAVEKILPQLGFSDLYHASKVRRFVPFDIVGTLDGERVLVDVTTAIGKSGPMYMSAAGFAEALRMKLYVLFVKPDLSHCAQKLASMEHGLHCSLKDLVAVG